MNVSLTEQDLVNIKLTVLTLERQEIARNIDPRRFFGHLRAKYIFDERDCDEIRSVTSRIGSAEAFVDILKRKGAQGYDEFCSALLKDRTQLFLLKQMTQTLEQLRAKVLDKKKEIAYVKLQQQVSVTLPPPPPQSNSSNQFTYHHPQHSAPQTVSTTAGPRQAVFTHHMANEIPPRHLIYQQGGSSTLPPSMGSSTLPPSMGSSTLPPSMGSSILPPSMGSSTMPPSLGPPTHSGFIPANPHKQLRKVNSRTPTGNETLLLSEIQPGYVNSMPLDFQLSSPVSYAPADCLPPMTYHHPLHSAILYEEQQVHDPLSPTAVFTAGGGPLSNYPPLPLMEPQGQRLVCRGIEDDSEIVTDNEN